MTDEEEELVNKIKDIQSIVFTKNTQEILTTMEIILTIYHIDNSVEIVKICKIKLLEGISELKKLGLEDKIKDFDLKA